MTLKTSPQPTAFLGARIFDGLYWHDESALLVADGRVTGVAAPADLPADCARHTLPGGMLVPGFIDLQVNGGGGVLFNEMPTLAGLETICVAHRQFGTTGLLPTLITDTPAITAQALAAGAAAVEAGLKGFLGLHLEGPHLSIARKGAHDPALIRPMTDADLNVLIAARKTLPSLLVTVAAETVTPDQITALSDAGIVVSLGHTDAPYAMAIAAAEAGATMATHLFNAMSQLGHREPGVVGAVLQSGTFYAGLIADNIHVAPAAMATALRAKAGPGRIFLVTDAMALTGTDQTSFTLNGREIVRADGALRLASGTLAGADLTMIEAVINVHRLLDVPLDEALRMAALYPAQAMGLAQSHGHLQPGAVASFVHLDADLGVSSTWIDGAQVWQRP